MSNPKMRTVLLCAFLFVTSLVIAKAGLEWTRGDDEPDDDAVVEQKDERKDVDVDVRLEHLRDLERLKENEARIQEHAARLAERLAARIEVAVDANDFDFDHEFDHDSDGELMIRKEFDVSPGGDLSVKVPGADVEVVSGSSKKAEVLVFLDARDMDKARSYFEDLAFEVGSSGNKVSVRAKSADRSRWGWNRHGHAHILVRAVIPEQFNADISTSGGDISVDRLEGRLELVTSGGDIELGSITGDKISVTTSGGDIEAGKLDGPVHVTTSGGDIELGSVSGPEITVRTSGGDIDAGMLQAERVDVRTSGGDISLGSVTGMAIVKTSGGDIKVARNAGSLEASTSGGDIEVRLAESSELRLNTTGGSIEIHGPSHIGADVDLRGSEVALEGDMRFDGTKKKNVVDGRVNGGGPKITATSGGGDISLELNQ